ncbi:MAG: hypothetical protein KAQ87_01255 [Candidatus Pacebacteria bacterium]|nr:hypothetical protein [Candidatus Paceibacterota bacterium]
MKISDNGSLECMFGAFVIIAFLAFGKFLLISFAGIGSLFLSLMIILFVTSLVVMFLIGYLSKFKKVETSVMWERFLSATIFVVFASLFGFVLFIPAVYYLAGWWIYHTIGTVVVISLILAKIMVRLVEGKTPHLFGENKKQEKITLAG